MHPCSFAVRDTVFLLQNFSRKKDHSSFSGARGGGRGRDIGVEGRDKLHDSLRVFSPQAPFMELSTRD